MLTTIRDAALLPACATLMFAVGCDPPRPTLSEHQVDQLLSLPAETTAASRQLVEQDAKARQTLVELHADVQAELAEIGRRQDQLEQDRKALAAQRRFDPIIAATIETVGLLAACLLPLVIVAILLWRKEPQHDVDAVCDYLMTEVIDSDSTRRLGNRNSPKLLTKKASSRKT